MHAVGENGKTDRSRSAGAPSNVTESLSMSDSASSSPAGQPKRVVQRKRPSLLRRKSAAEATSKLVQTPLTSTSAIAPADSAYGSPAIMRLTSARASPCFRNRTVSTNASMRAYRYRNDRPSPSATAALVATFAVRLAEPNQTPSSHSNPTKTPTTTTANAENTTARLRAKPTPRSRRLSNAYVSPSGAMNNGMDTYCAYARNENVLASGAMAASVLSADARK